MALSSPELLLLRASIYIFFDLLYVIYAIYIRHESPVFSLVIEILLFSIQLLELLIAYKPSLEGLTYSEAHEYAGIGMQVTLIALILPGVVTLALAITGICEKDARKSLDIISCVWPILIFILAVGLSFVKALFVLGQFYGLTREDDSARNFIYSETPSQLQFEQSFARSIAVRCHRPAGSILLALRKMKLKASDFVLKTVWFTYPSGIRKAGIAIAGLALHGVYRYIGQQALFRLTSKGVEDISNNEQCDMVNEFISKFVMENSPTLREALATYLSIYPGSPLTKGTILVDMAKECPEDPIVKACIPSTITLPNKK